MSHLEIFSRPQVIENYMRYLLLRTENSRWVPLSWEDCQAFKNLEPQLAGLLRFSRA